MTSLASSLVILRSVVLAGLEWPVVFVPKFIDHVMPVGFSSKRAIPGDDTLAENLAITAVQADARMRGKSLKTKDDVMDYLPEWLEQDNLLYEEQISRIDWEEFGMAPDESFGNHTSVSNSYKRKKEKQHNEVCFRLNPGHIKHSFARDFLL